MCVVKNFLSISSKPKKNTCFLIPIHIQKLTTTYKFILNIYFLIAKLFSIVALENFHLIRSNVPRVQQHWKKNNLSKIDWFKKRLFQYPKKIIMPTRNYFEVEIYCNITNHVNSRQCHLHQWQKNCQEKKQKVKKKQQNKISQNYRNSKNYRN